MAMDDKPVNIHNETNINEIEKLVDFVEDTSRQIYNLEKEIVRSRVFIAIGAIVFYIIFSATFLSIKEFGLTKIFGYFFVPALLIFAISVMIGILVFIIPQFYFLKLKKRELKVQLFVVGDLIETVSGLIDMEDVHKKMSLISIKILKSRLRRIKFSAETVDRFTIFRDSAP
ncbi:MAG: hypothetical protein H7833_15155 [Magnetococcus sp. DMHC-1]|nr:hypothetical protein [Magnetococcales bacterium]